MALFKPNPNLGEELSQDAGARKGLAEAAEEAKPFIEQAASDAGAPWMPRPGHEVIEVASDDEGVYIVNTDYAAHLQEFGSIRNPPLAPLRRGAESAGLRVEESPKP